MSTIWREDTPASTEVFRVQVAFSRRIEVRSTRKWALSWSRDKLRKAQTHAHTTWRESDGERLSPFTAKPTLTTQPRSRSFPASPVPSPPPLYTYTHTDTYTQTRSPLQFHTPYTHTRWSLVLHTHTCTTTQYPQTRTYEHTARYTRPDLLTSTLSHACYSHIHI